MFPMPNKAKLNWIELNWIELNWIELRRLARKAPLAFKCLNGQSGFWLWLTDKLVGASAVLDTRHKLKLRTVTYKPKTDCALWKTHMFTLKYADADICLMHLKLTFKRVQCAEADKVIVT